MDTRLKVLLYGDTLVLAGVYAGLSTYATLDVVLNPGVNLQVQSLRELAPDVIILEPNAVPPTSLATLAEELPDVLLLSIDAERGRILLWSGRRLQPLSTDDFVRLIGRYAASATEPEAVTQHTDAAHGDGTVC